MWNGTDRRRPSLGNERMAVQEALQDVMEKEVDELKVAITELTKQLTSLAAILSERTSAMDGKHLTLAERVGKMEAAAASIKSFVAGVSFAFGCIGGIVGAGFTIVFKLGAH